MLAYSSCAHAQGYPGGGPPTPSHYWQVTYTSVGTATMNRIQGNLSNIVYVSTPWADTAGETQGVGGVGGQYTVDATSCGTVTATLTWVPTTG